MAWVWIRIEACRSHENAVPASLLKWVVHGPQRSAGRGHARDKKEAWRPRNPMKNAPVGAGVGNSDHAASCCREGARLCYGDRDGAFHNAKGTMGESPSVRQKNKTLRVFKEGKKITADDCDAGSGYSRVSGA